MKHYLLLLLPIFLSSCSDKLYVTNQLLNPDYLASSYVGSPDPDAAHFTSGVQLSIEWNVSYATLDKNPQLIVDVIFGDLTEQHFEFKVTQCSDFRTIRLLEPVFSEKKGVLTFKAEIQTEDHEMVAEWKHQLWTPILHIDGETI